MAQPIDLADPDRALIAGNWKMNLLQAEAVALATAVAAWSAPVAAAGVDLLLCPPAPFLAGAIGAVAGGAVAVGGQDCHAKASGAHTGDVAAPMLASLGCRAVIVGHSERRRDHRETDPLVRAKVEAAIAAGLVAVLCVGETLEERDAGQTAQVVTRQLRAALVEAATDANLVVAYEPIWAIGTGRTPAPGDVVAAHAALRSILAARAPTSRARILYGGSVTAQNARALLALPEVAGALVGGASLKGAEFRAIAEAAAALRRQPA